MPEREETTLIEAARRYLATLSDEERIASQAEIQRFARWCGADRDCSQLRGQEVANYGETLTGTVTDATRRAETVRRFLAFAKKAGLTRTNLGTHLRLRKTAAAPPVARGPAPKKIHLSEEAKMAMEMEVEALKVQRPRIASDIKRAMEDKDFRENAPLDAARQERAYVEGRIRELEATLADAVVVQETAGPSGDAADIGSRVVLRNLQSGAETTYVLARPRDANAGEGRISVESPVGRALRKRRAGEEVEVEVPSGTLRFQIERVEG